VQVVSVTPVLPEAAPAAPVTDYAGFAVLAIEAPAARQLTAGVPLIGTVTVAPLDAGTARGVRLELVLDEHVPARPREPLEEDCDATTVVVAVSLAENVGLQPGQMLRLPFTLPVPEWLPAPSVSTADSRCVGSSGPYSTARCTATRPPASSWRPHRITARSTAAPTLCVTRHHPKGSHRM
jgi:hypothetical protein